MIIFHSGFSHGFDGPGTRLVFYLKGCNFHCDWCASPESIRPVPELLYSPDRNADSECAGCPKKAYGGSGVLNREICERCQTFDCIRIWHNPAFERAGEEISPEKVLHRAESARNFISGVTFGGGEPTLQSSELIRACHLLRKNGFHVAMESNASTPGFPDLIGEVDLLFADLKTLNPEIARKRMSADISLVKDNLREAASRQTNFTLRIPVVRGVNDGEQEQSEILEFCRELKCLRPDGILKVELLRQHHLGEPKYAALGRAYLLKGTSLPEKKILEQFSSRLKNAGIHATIFG